MQCYLLSVQQFQYASKPVAAGGMFFWGETNNPPTVTPPVSRVTGTTPGRSVGQQPRTYPI